MSEPGPWERVQLARLAALERNLASLRAWAATAAPDDAAIATEVSELLCAPTLRAMRELQEVDIPAARALDASHEEPASG